MKKEDVFKIIDDLCPPADHSFTYLKSKQAELDMEYGRALIDVKEAISDNIEDDEFISGENYYKGVGVYGIRETFLHSDGREEVHYCPLIFKTLRLARRNLIKNGYKRTFLQNSFKNPETGWMCDIIKHRLVLK